MDNKDTTPSRTPTPDDSEWKTVVIRWTRGDAADVRMLPVEERGNAVTKIYKGEAVLLRPDLQHESWVPVRVGRFMGWVNMDDIRVLSEGAEIDQKKRSMQRLINTVKNL